MPFQSHFSAKFGNLKRNYGHRDCMWWVVFYLYHSKFIFLLSGFLYINWVLASSISINSPSVFSFFYDESFLQSLLPALMSCHSSKGKRKASPAPASPSYDKSNTSPNLEHPPTKKPQLSSPACVRQVAMVKVESTSKLVGSSSKGMAGFAALINSASLSAACKETNQGLCSGSSLKRSGSQSKAGKVVQFLYSFIC